MAPTTLTAPPSDQAPAAVLDSLRGDRHRRPDVDLGLAGGLREWLEDGLCPLLPLLPTPLAVNKRMLRDVLAGRPALDGPEPVLSTPLALGLLMDALFRQLVTTGAIEDPMRDGLDALRIDDRRSGIVDYVEALPLDDRARLRDEVETQCAIVLSRWPRLSPHWLPRTQERLVVPLAGGEVLLVGVVDLIVGAPSRGRASVALIEAKSGHQRPEDRDDLWFYGLLETLRSGAPPSRLATFYTRTGTVDAQDVDDERLAASLQRVLTALATLAEQHR